jgi:alkylation response protein AidB-like acyl-CoA dehydrogenase
MDFTSTPIQREIRDRVKQIAEKHCSAEQERSRDADGHFPDSLYHDLAQSGLLTLWRRAASGSGMLDGCILSEALGEVSATASSLIFVSGAY